MFRVEENDSTSLIVRAGLHLRYVGGVEFDVGVDVGGRTSIDPDDTVDVTGITVTQWIYAMVDDVTTPTSVSIGATGSDAVPTAGDQSVLPLARVICVGGKIDRIVPAHEGVWEVGGGGGYGYDNLSINLDSSGLLQAYGWETAVSNPSINRSVDLWSYQGYGGGADPLARHYATLDDMAASIAEALLAGPWDSGTEPWPTDHHTIGGTHDGDEDIDHPAFWCNALSGDYDSSYIRNYGDSIGDPYGVKVVDLLNQALCEDSDQYLIWTLGQLINGVGAAVVLDWLNSRLHGDWTQYDATGHLLMLGNEAITPGTAASGALRCVGGASLQGAIQALAYYLIGDAANNYWTTSALSVVNAGANQIRGDSVTLAHGPSASSYLTVSAGDILLYAASGGALRIDDGAAGTKSATWKRMADVGPEELVLVGA